MINLAILHGRLTAIPELRHTESGKAVCSFSIANDTGFGDKKTTHFFGCVAWGSTAEFICKYFTKGQEIAVSGQLQTREWFDKKGSKRETVELVVREADFCGKRGESGFESKSAELTTSASGGDFQQPNINSAENIDNVGNGDFEEYDGDLPF